MIKGVLNTNDHRFGDNINSFIELVSIINLKYKITEVKDADVVKEHLEIEFNGFKSVKIFSKALKTNYENAIDEIDETLLINFRKNDRFKFVRNLILKFKDIQKLLINDSVTGFKHKNFNISSNKKIIGKRIDESYCQEYYVTINKYLSKMRSFLKLEKNIQKHLNDSDIELHKINIPSEYESTKDNPIKFFQYLITKKGVSSLLEQFKPSKDYFSRHDIDYDDDSKTITYNHYDVENGRHFATKLTFNEYFVKRLKAEFKKSQQLINEHFKTLPSEAKASFFLKLTLNDLKSLAKNVESDKDALGNADIKKPINALFKHIKTKYKAFIIPEKANNNQAYFFQLIGKESEIYDKAVDLHDSLVLNEFLEKDSKNDFIKLFTGQQPSNKITWVGNKNQLRLFIKLLKSEAKIENCNIWQITVANFKDKDVDFTNLQFKDGKKPVDKSIIESIVSNISH